MSLEANKLLAGILVAGITAMVGGMAANAMVNPAVPEKNVIGIEVADEGHAEGGAAAPAEAQDPPFDPAKFAAADVAHGEQLSKACLSCHSFDNGGPNKVGPNLWGIVGNHHGHSATFAYSDAMKALSGETWDYAKLYTFLRSPKQAMPGTKMSFAGLRKPQDRYDLLLWLRTKADSPAPMP